MHSQPSPAFGPQVLIRREFYLEQFTLEKEIEDLPVRLKKNQILNNVFLKTKIFHHSKSQKTMKHVILIFASLLAAVSVYSQAPNTWTLKAPFGGTARWGAVGFSMGSKGYLGTGSNYGVGPFTTTISGNMILL
ncbi:MAG: hypothetical protein IPG01_10485 [Chitinophagaceae bacterium]|nr:hypothetical protein [Chitinophagaceae bacterium]